MRSVSVWSWCGSDIGKFLFIYDWQLAVTSSFIIQDNMSNKNSHRLKIYYNVSSKIIALELNGSYCILNGINSVQCGILCFTKRIMYFYFHCTRSPVCFCLVYLVQCALKKKNRYMYLNINTDVWKWIC